MRMDAPDSLLLASAALFGLAAGLAVRAFRRSPSLAGPVDWGPGWSRAAKAALWRVSQRLSGEDLRLQLMLAGYFSPWAPGLYRALQGASACAGAVGGALAAPQGMGFAAPGVALLSALAAASLPGVWLGLGRKRRNARLSLALPYGIELLCIALSGGSTVEDALRRAAFGLRPFAPDLAGEFARLSFALGAGAATQQPCPPEVLKDVATLLRQGAVHGLRLIPSLRNLAAHLRAEHAIRFEEAALRLGPKLTIPLIVFFLPPIFLLILTPVLATFLKP